ncbi:MAG: ArnT family glycosyltransferase, partial [Novosphingobium sp.]
MLAALATRAPYFGHPAADYDEQLYSLIGAQWANGLLPYTDLWDRKPPGLFLLFAAAHAVGGDSPLSYQLLAAFACLIGGWQVWRLALRTTEPGTAALAASLYPVLMALLDIHSGQSEIFFVPVLMAMAQLLLAASERPLTRARGLCLAAMAAGGIALQIKYTVLAQCLFFGLCALWLLRRKGRGNAGLLADAALFGFLGILPTLLAAGAFAAKGHLDDFVYANFVSSGLRGVMPWSLVWLDQLALAVPQLALLAVGALAVWRSGGWGAFPYWRLTLAWFGAAVLGLFMVRTIYPYYYAALVPPAILAAVPMFSRPRIGLAAWAVFFLGMLAGYNPVERFFWARDEQQVLGAMTIAIAPHVSAGSHCLYVFDGPTALYRLTGSGLPTRFIYPDHLNNALEAHALPVDPAREIERIFAQRPGAVVTSLDPVTVQNPKTNEI